MKQWKQKTKGEKELDIAAIARIHVKDSLKEAVHGIKVVVNSVAISDLDREKAIEAQRLMKEALALLKKTRFKDSEQVKWIKKGAKR